MELRRSNLDDRPRPLIDRARTTAMMRIKGANVTEMDFRTITDTDMEEVIKMLGLSWNFDPAEVLYFESGEKYEV